MKIELTYSETKELLNNGVSKEDINYFTNGTKFSTDAMDDFIELIKNRIDNDNFTNVTEMINTLNDISIDDFFELTSDGFAESINNVDDIIVLSDYIDTIRDNIQKEFGGIYNDYTFQPSEDGGIYTESNILKEFDFGLLTDFINCTAVIEIRIDLRPSCYSYVGLHVINDNNKQSMLGEYNYLHFEVLSDGSLDTPTLESM